MIGKRKEEGLVTATAASARKMAMEAGRHGLGSVMECFKADRRTLSWRASRNFPVEHESVAALAAEVATSAMASYASILQRKRVKVWE